MAKKKKGSKNRKVKEIKRKIKEIKKEVEKSELEKDIIEEKAEGTEFKEFLQPIEIPAPILKRVETPVQEPLELNIASTPTPSIKETGVDYTVGNEPKYAMATDNLNETKYESDFRPPILRPTDSERFREEILIPQRQIDVPEIEDTNKIETRTLEQKRKEPFEREEKKYRKVDF